MAKAKSNVKKSVIVVPSPLTPSDKLIIDLVAQAYSAGVLPDQPIVETQINKFLMMDVSTVVAMIINNPSFAIYRSMVYNIVSSMSDKEVANTLITSLDKYYPDIIEQIYSDEKMTTMFVDVFKGVLREVRNA